jgi:hypothetical protein
METAQNKVNEAISKALEKTQEPHT